MLKDLGNLVMRPAAAKDDQGVLAKGGTYVAQLGLATWNRLTLVSKFTMLTCLILLTLSGFSEWIQDKIAARSMVESSLEVEQALARAVVVPLLGDQPLTHMMPKSMAASLDKAIGNPLYSRYISKLKVWGTAGRLIYDSDSPVPVLNVEVPAVLRALAGETVVAVADQATAENVNDQNAGEVVYEVYMPLYNSAGTLIAIAEIYCNIELGGARIQAMLVEIDRVRLVALLLGMSLLVVLVYFAQRRIDSQEDAIVTTLRATEQLAQTNAQLLRDSERMRRSSAEANEQLLNQIGAELHDGPIQLLSIAALYRGQSDATSAENPLLSKARVLSDQALRDLRNISVGLILPELEGVSLQECVRRASAAFTQDTGLNVDVRVKDAEDFLSMPELVVAYRVVQEALHNARKHAGGTGLRVTVQSLPKQYEIEIEDSGQGVPPALDDYGVTEHDSISMGLLGMQKRARSVGGALSVRQHNLGTVVRLTFGSPKFPQF